MNKIFNYTQILGTAKSLQKTWGFGFPVISMKMLSPFLEQIQIKIKELEAENLRLKEKIESRISRDTEQPKWDQMKP